VCVCVCERCSNVNLQVQINFVSSSSSQFSSLKSSVVLNFKTFQNMEVAQCLAVPTSGIRLLGWRCGPHTAMTYGSAVLKGGSDSNKAFCNGKDYKQIFVRHVSMCANHSKCKQSILVCK